MPGATRSSTDLDSAAPVSATDFLSSASLTSGSTSRSAPAVIPCREPNDAPGIITDNLGATYLCAPRTIDPTNPTD
ncbi:hypothetical protein, partial [Rothia nasisuis]